MILFYTVKKRQVPDICLLEASRVSPVKEHPKHFPLSVQMPSEGALLVWLRLIKQKDPLLEYVHMADRTVRVAGMVILFRSTLLYRVSGVKCALKRRCCISIASFQADRQSSPPLPPELSMQSLSTDSQ